MGSIRINEELYRTGYNPYRELKPRVQVNVRNQAYLDLFRNGFAQMWVINGLPENSDYREFILNLTLLGRVGFTNKGGFDFGRFEETGGKLDRYGHLSNGIVTFANGENVTGVIGRDVVPVYLNKMKTKEPNFERFADMLSQVDLSMKLNIEKTRLNPIPIFKDQKIRDEIQASIKAIRDGEQKFYLYDTTLASTFGDATNSNTGSSQFDLLNLTDIKDIDKITYLSEFHQDVVERLAILYGFSMSKSNKLAQVNEDEIKGYTELARVYILNMLESIKEGFDNVNKAFGTNLTITLSKPWAWILENPKENEERIINNEQENERTDN